MQSRYYNPTWGRFLNADNIDYLGADGSLLSYNLFAYCQNNPVMFTDPNGYAPQWWQWAISGALVVAGIVLVATGVGCVAGGTLICAGTNSIIGSYMSEATGGSSVAGWAGGMVTGAIGSVAGQEVSAAIDGKKLNRKEVVTSSVTTGAINCISGLGAGIGTAIQGMPVISTTTTTLANSLNAVCSIVSEMVCDFLGTIPSLFTWTPACFRG